MTDHKNKHQAFDPGKNEQSKGQQQDKKTPGKSQQEGHKGSRKESMPDPDQQPMMGSDDDEPGRKARQMERSNDNSKELSVP
jgi:hypothetical protein